MQIGAVGLEPFIYNTNQVSAASMNRVPAVPNDINAERTDYSGLVGNDENTNQLQPGESANFANIIEEQMSRSQQNAARIIRDDTAVENTAVENNAMIGNAGVEAAVGIVGNPVENFQLETPVTGNELTGGTAFNNVIPDALDVPYTNAAVDYAEARASEITVADQLTETSQPSNQSNVYQMQRATEAYAMVMGL
ncbi:MAG: hypothetical protein FWE14_07910 [Lachnospiraceae bacterium]|nr:hypothetical protein [Lachnospiraceae bacterium]